MASTSIPIERIVRNGLTETIQEKTVQHLLLDPKSQLRDALDTEAVERYKSTIRPRNELPPVVINFKLSSNQQKLLEDAYPEFALRFVETSAVGHPMAASMRILESKLIFETFINVKNSSNVMPEYQGYDCYVNDIGGNCLSLIRRDYDHFHVCDPKLNLYDSYRDTNRILQTITMNRETMPSTVNEKLNNYHSYCCGKKVQDCDKTALFATLIHSNYDISLQDLVDSLSKKNVMAAYGCFIFSPEILFADKGTIEGIDCNYSIFKRGCKRIIRFTFVGDTSFGYEHELAYYLEYVKKSVMVSRDGGHFVLELLNNRLGVQFFRICRVNKNFSFYDQLVHPLPFSFNVDTVRIKYYTWTYLNMETTNVSLLLKPHYMYFNKKHYRDILAYAMGLSDSKFQPANVYDFAKSCTTRVIHNAKNVSEFEFPDPISLYRISGAIYMIAFKHKYEVGKVTEALVSEQKGMREMKAGFFKKIFAYVSSLFPSSDTEKSVREFVKETKNNHYLWDLYADMGKEFVQVGIEDVMVEEIYNDGLDFLSKIFDNRDYSIMDFEHLLIQHEGESVFERLAAEYKENLIVNITEEGVDIESDDENVKLVGGFKILPPLLDDSHGHHGVEIDCSRTNHPVKFNPGDGMCLYYSLLGENNMEGVNQVIEALIAADKSIYAPATCAEIMDILINRKPGTVDIVDLFCMHFSKTVHLHILDSANCQCYKFGVPGTEVIHIKFVGTGVSVGHYERIDDKPLVMVKPMRSVSSVSSVTSGVVSGSINTMSSLSTLNLDREFSDIVKRINGDVSEVSSVGTDKNVELDFGVKGSTVTSRCNSDFGSNLSVRDVGLRKLPFIKKKKESGMETIETDVEDLDNLYKDIKDRKTEIFSMLDIYKKKSAEWSDIPDLRDLQKSFIRESKFKRKVSVISYRDCSLYLQTSQLDMLFLDNITKIYVTTRNHISTNPEKFVFTYKGELFMFSIDGLIVIFHKPAEGSNTNKINLPFILDSIIDLTKKNFRGFITHKYMNSVTIARPPIIDAKFHNKTLSLYSSPTYEFSIEGASNYYIYDRWRQIGLNKIENIKSFRNSIRMTSTFNVPDGSVVFIHKWNFKKMAASSILAEVHKSRCSRISLVFSDDSRMQSFLRLLDISELNFREFHKIPKICPIFKSQIRSPFGEFISEYPEFMSSRTLMVSDSSSNIAHVVGNKLAVIATYDFVNANIAQDRIIITDPFNISFCGKFRCIIFDIEGYLGDVGKLHSFLSARLIPRGSLIYRFRPTEGCTTIPFILRRSGVVHYHVVNPGMAYIVTRSYNHSDTIHSDIIDLNLKTLLGFLVEDRGDGDSDSCDSQSIISVVDAMERTKEYVDSLSSGYGEVAVPKQKGVTLAPDIAHSTSEDLIAGDVEIGQIPDSHGLDVISSNKFTNSLKTYVNSGICEVAGDSARVDEAIYTILNNSNLKSINEKFKKFGKNMNDLEILFSVIELLDSRELEENGFYDKYFTSSEFEEFYSKYLVKLKFYDSKLGNIKMNVITKNQSEVECDDNKCLLYSLSTLRVDDLPVIRNNSILLDWIANTDVKNRYDPQFEKNPNNDFIIDVRNSIREAWAMWSVTPLLLKKIHQDLFERYRIDRDHWSYAEKRRLQSERKNLGVFDLKTKKYIVKPNSKRVIHNYVFDGQKFLPVDTVVGDTKHCLVSDDMECMNEGALLAATDNLNMFYYNKPEFINIQGVPGCGKTTYICTNAGRNDLILTATRDGCASVKSKLDHMNKKIKNVSTVHSYLINSKQSEFSTVWIDEALKEHFGVINLVVLKSSCKKIILIGDNNQIPYFNNVPSVLPLHANTCNFVAENQYLTRSYRIPVDVAYMFRKIYNNKLTTANPVLKSMRAEIKPNLAHLPKFLPENTKILVFKKIEKQQLTEAGYKDVSTVGEFQGCEKPNIICVRTSSVERDEIYTRIDQILVCATRHTKSFCYYTPIKDKLYDMIASLPSESVLKDAYDPVENTKLVGGYTGTSNIELCNVETSYQPQKLIWYYGSNSLMRDTVDLNYGHKSAPMSFVRIFSSSYLPIKPVNYVLPRGGDLQVLQTYYDDMLPGNSVRDYKYDQYLAEKEPLEFYYDNVVITMSKLEPMREARTVLTPMLRTSMAWDRQSTQFDAMIGLAKRNLNVPELDELVDFEYFSSLAVDKFVNTYIDPTCLDVFESFSSDDSLIYPNDYIIEQWFRDQPDSVRDQIKELFIVVESHLSKYSLMNKRQIKPGLETKSAFEYAAVQTIASQSKYHNMIFCPIFRELKRRLISVLSPRFMMYCDMSPSEFAEEMTMKMDPRILNLLKKLEIDIGKYDKSQYRLLFEIECNLYRKLGLPEVFITLWKLAHEETYLKDFSNGVEVFVKYQRKSGDASTFFGNTLVLMCVLCVLFDLSDAYGVFSGDDSVLWLKFIEDRNAYCASIFNLESKFFRYEYSYFCSKFLLNDGLTWYFVPDPLKVLTKLGRHNIVTWEHLEEYRISLLDLLSDYKVSSIHYLLEKAMDERYGVARYSLSFVLATMLEYISSKKSFEELFYVKDGEVLSADPSHQILD